MHSTIEFKKILVYRTQVDICPIALYISRVITLNRISIAVETTHMRTLIAAILINMIIGVNAAVTEINISNSDQLVESLKSILKSIHRKPRQLNHLYNEIILKPGYYIIGPDQKFFKDEYLHLKHRGLMDVQQVRLDILVDYDWPHEKKLIFSGSVEQALQWLDKRLSIGMSLGQEIVYSVNTDKELYQALKASVNNRQNTVIKIRNCKKYPCVSNKSWLKKIYELKMPFSDGMRLRISSKFSSLDQEKWIFFKNKMKPFTEAY